MPASQKASPNTTPPHDMTAPTSTAFSPSHPHQTSGSRSVSEASTVDRPSPPHVMSPLETPAETPKASDASQSSWPFRFSRGSSSSSRRNGSPRPSASTSIPLENLLGMSSSGRKILPPPADAQPVEPTTKDQQKVVGIKVIKEGNALIPDKLLTGDIVKQVRIEGKRTTTFLSSADGKKGLFESLRCYSCQDHRFFIEVERQGCAIFESKALVIKNSKTSAILLDFQDESHEFTFEDYDSPLDCMRLQEEQLQGMKVKAAIVNFSKANCPQIDTCYSMVVVPHWNTNLSRFDNVDETVSQAMSWFIASKSSGVPLNFLSIQIEPFVLELESSTNNGLSSISSTGTYGLQQSRGGASLDVVRAIRIWFQFEFPELKIELQAWEGEDKLGVKIEGTAEGFCHVTDVVPNTVAERTDLLKKLNDANKLGNQLVVTRIGNEKVLPWFMSDGKIRCFDVKSILNILKAYWHARRPAPLHILDIKVPPYMASMPEERVQAPPSPASVYNGGHTA